MDIKKNLVRIGLPLAGVLLSVVAWRVIAEGKPPTDTTPPQVTPAQPPRDVAVVAGAGVVEPASELIAIASPVSGIVTAVPVRVGQLVPKGQALYTLDDTELRAELAVRRAAAASAARRITVAEVDLQDKQASLDLYRRIGDPRATTQEEMNRREFAVQSARARLAEAQAVASEAQAAVDETTARLAMRTVRAPMDGTVLQVKVRPGQFAPASQLAEPLLTMGLLDPLHVRVDLDEADIVRLGSAPRARVSARGSNSPATLAELVRVEPLVVPKRSLTNAVSERVDTRVLQLVFALPRNTQGFRVGQQVDAFIETGAPR